MVIIAKPGSGKTLVLSEKIRGVLPGIARHQGVIAISYTNKASDELKRRSTRGGIDRKSSFFGTIDKFCDGEIIIPFLRQLWGKPENEVNVRKYVSLSEEEKGAIPDPGRSSIPAEDVADNLDQIRRLFLDGTLVLDATGALAVYVLNNSEPCRRYLISRYTHILIDEYQDAGPEQHALFLRMKDLGMTAVAVGDADQSIFKFSGKDSRFLLELAKRDDFRSMPVNYNHRCHPSIINYSQRLLNENAEVLDTEECRVFLKATQGDQKAIAQWIDSYLSTAMTAYDVRNNCEVGILVRNNLSGELVSGSFGTPHRLFVTHPLEDHFSLWGGLFCRLLTYRYDDRATIQDIIDASRGSLSSGDSRKVRQRIRALRNCEHAELLLLIEEIASILEPGSHDDGALRILEESGENGLAASFSPANEDEVQVMSIHKAKGLEFDLVFQLDLYEWSFPAKGPGPDDDWDNLVFHDWNQDLNLHYVAITRARKACVLCSSTRRTKKKWQSEELETKNGRPSEFLSLSGLPALRKELGS